jgi:hypothetical protein
MGGVRLLVDGYWLPSHRADPRAYALYRRHYSAAKNSTSRRTQTSNFMGPGECMVLLTEDCQAVFAWQRNTTQRYDHQTGVICTLFRNEGPVLSSELIREASELARQRWPGERLFTYVADNKIRSTNPGYCFLKAGWRTCGRNADGRLTILELVT